MEVGVIFANLLLRLAKMLLNMVKTVSFIVNCCGFVSLSEIPGTIGFISLKQKKKETVFLPSTSTQIDSGYSFTTSRTVFH